MNHIVSEKEEALRNLKSETAKLVRRCLEKDHVMHFACSLPLLSLSFPEDHHLWLFLCLEKSQLFESALALRMKCLAWGPQAQALFPDPLSGTRVQFSPSMHLSLSPILEKGEGESTRVELVYPHYLFLSTGKKQQGSRQEGGGTSEEGKVGHP